MPAEAKKFSCDGGDAACLIDAISAANANGKANTTTLSAGVYTLTAAGSDGQTGLPVITGDLAIVGEGAENTVIERSGGVRFRRAPCAPTRSFMALTPAPGFSVRVFRWRNVTSSPFIAAAPSTSSCTGSIARTTARSVCGWTLGAGRALVMPLTGRSPAAIRNRRHRAAHARRRNSTLIDPGPFGPPTSKPPCKASSSFRPIWRCSSPLQIHRRRKERRHDRRQKRPEPERGQSRWYARFRLPRMTKGRSQRTRSNRSDLRGGAATPGCGGRATRPLVVNELAGNESADRRE